MQCSAVFSGILCQHCAQLRHKIKKAVPVFYPRHGRANHSPSSKTGRSLPFLRTNLARKGKEKWHPAPNAEQHSRLELSSAWLAAKSRQLPRKRKSRSHANGMGTVFKRGKSWYCEKTMGWRLREDGTRQRIIVRKGGFKTSADAWAYLPQLTAAPSGILSVDPKRRPVATVSSPSRRRS